jgi:para-aminobenzoate synthetase component 1
MKIPITASKISATCMPFKWLRAAVNGKKRYPALLESSGHNTRLGRYSILCWDPVKRLTCSGETIVVEHLQNGARTEISGADPFYVLSAEFDPCRCEVPAGFPLPFAGGAIGYFSYDLRHHVESLPRQCSYDVDAPEFILSFYDRGLVFDHRQSATYWVAPSGARRPDLQPGASGARMVPKGEDQTELNSNFTPSQYKTAVQRVIDYIAAGDIFQANLSQRFHAQTCAEGIDLYERLSRINPAPFAAYLGYDDLEIISSSPERFLLLDGDIVTTRPIKGTRPRIDGDTDHNRRMKKELLNSIKDHAELAMIVDLERNDLGKVCRYGSVKVKKHAELETYPTVYHLVSTVEGRLFRGHYDEFSLLRAMFPGGSITGAPKVRAMEIIEELEPHARNVYTGSIGYISFHGRMDLNIAIRTMVKKNDRLYMQFGGGITADSDPTMEYCETIHKGKALFKAAGAINYNDIIKTAEE